MGTHVKDKRVPDMKPFLDELRFNIPAAVRDAEFDDRGFVIKDGNLLVPAYFASHLGFSYPGHVSKEEQWYPAMEEIGIYVFCPFNACTDHWVKNYMDFLADGTQSNDDHIAMWDLFNRELGYINYKQLIPKSKLLVANLDIEDIGVAAEVAHYVVSGRGPAVGVRTRFTLAENPATKVNPALRYFLDMGPWAAINRYYQSNSAHKSPEMVWKNALEGIKEEVIGIRKAA